MKQITKLPWGILLEFLAGVMIGTHPAKIYSIF